MGSSIELVESALPLAYSIASALLIFHLARKPVHLDQYDVLKDNLGQDDVPASSNGPHSQRDSSPLSDSAIIELIQAQHQAQRTSGMSINLARFGLTAFQLGLAFFSLVTFHFGKTDENVPEGGDDGRAGSIHFTLLGDAVKVAAWGYALALSLVHLIRPAVAFQFWIRTQMDLFYILELALSSITLYQLDVLAVPFSEWSLRFKVEDAAWLATVLLVWISLITRPIQRLVPVKVPRVGEVPRIPSKEFASSLYSQFAFSWINSLIYLGFKRPLQDVDLPELEVVDQSNYSIRKFKSLKRQTFIRTLLAALWSDTLLQLFWSIPYSVLLLSGPFCLNKIIKYIECKDCGPPTFDNYKWVIILLVASILQSLAQQQALHRGRRLFVHATSICNAAIFAKTLRRKDVTSSASGEESKGKKEGDDKKDRTMNISNLVAVDIKELEQAFCYMYEFYGLPIQFILCTTQLYNLLGPSALIGIGSMIVTLPIPAMLFSFLHKLFKSIMQTKDDRMDYITELLSAIRIVKFFGWESKFVEKITACREVELQKTKKTWVQMSVASIAWMVVPLFNLVVFLVTYTKFYGNTISASILFTTLSLFNILSATLSHIPWAIMSFSKAGVSLKRISKYLDDEEVVKDTTVTKIDGKARVHTISHPVIGFVDASYSWPNKEHDKVEAKGEKKASWFQNLKTKFSKSPKPAEDPVAEPEAVQERFKLKNISADFPVGQMSLIVGSTGSGKSALLLALLGEMERLEGHMYLPRLDYGNYGHGSGIAYVSQTAWLQNSTIRDNILFGKAFDQERYDTVVEGCALITDFDILESGDATEIGEQGITLSGGQKQRVALARAIYSDASVLLLDDCLSAVDSHTGKQLFQTLTGPLLENRTILMATHQVQLTLNGAAFVVVLDKGEIIGSGTPETVMSNGWVDRVTLDTTPIPDDASEVNTLDGDEPSKKAKVTEKKKVKLTEDEKKTEGTVAWKVYKAYLVASGGWLAWSVMFIFLIGSQAIRMGKSAWLAIWANRMAEATGEFAIMTFEAITPEPLVLSLYTAFSPVHGSDYGAFTMSLFGKGTPETVSVEYYLGIYILISIGATIFSSLAGYYAMVYGSIRGSRIMHAQLLHKVSRAKVRFYDTTPIGRIINRFSSDMASIDEEVLRGLQSFMDVVVEIVGIFLLISVNMPVFLIAAAFIAAINVAIGIFYVPISRDLKRLNANSKSPILNHFNETLKGVTTIRAFGFESQFQSTNEVNLDNNNRTFFLLWSTNRWLHWRVDIAGALVSFTTGILLLQNWGKIEPGWAAMTLTYALMFTENVVWLIRLYAQNEVNMNAVERVVEYLDLEEEAPAIIEGSRPPASWPHAGEIEVDHLTMRYAADTPEVLKDLTFKIKAGEKVGVVGRTGSGKSTLAISLFRFMEPTRGSIRIDGIDISKIGLHDLRTRLTIIPQDPILFKGTLRSNLDPFGELEDRELWQALRRSHLIPAEDAVAWREGTGSSSNKDAPSGSSSAASVEGSQSDAPDKIDSSKITLDTIVKENGSNFSQGQRQLISLARALVRQSKIIVMDEATASVDFETDQKIQTTIREEMSDATMITIAHRIRTIADFDRVLVLNAGEVVEFDKPYRLMKQENSVFRSMCERSTDFEALLTIMEANEKRDIAAGL
ncbi:hypothetical protein EDD21DRAFT_142144 [Dissophora ornata]|nr:hypothetical protein BGZ58_005839 [Dissophora ornata]KAI8600087.1 hypothetical protein EDD21DRAFT_142144 [Dissophora ornata]